MLLSSRYQQELDAVYRDSEVIDEIMLSEQRAMNPSEASATSNAKASVRDRDGNECWNCGAEAPLQTCHIYPKAQAHQVRIHPSSIRKYLGGKCCIVFSC